MSRQVAAILALLIACGGKAVIDGAGGAGGSSHGGAGPGGSGSGNNPTGVGGCKAHTDCSFGDVCIFATGTCAIGCNGETCDACTNTLKCDACATSSCPDCLDCRGACIPVGNDCDDNDLCPNGNDTCLYGPNICVRRCNPNGSCPMGLFCEPCVTSTCCNCDDCIDACVP